MYMDSVSRYYKKQELENNINNLLSNCKTKNERREAVTSLRSAVKLDSISDYILRNYQGSSIMLTG